MPPKTHEQMIRELNAMMGGADKPKRSKRVAMLAVKFSVSAAWAVAYIGLLGLMLFGMLDTLNSIGAIGFSVSYWQAVTLIALPVFILLTLPLTVNVRGK